MSEEQPPPYEKPEPPEHLKIPDVHRCDLCGAPMKEWHCRIICEFCGYQRDCSDP